MEKVKHPNHYVEGRRYEPIDVIDDWNLNFCLGNSVKYISRIGRKDNDIEDIQKAIFYLEYELNKRRKENVDKRANVGFVEEQQASCIESNHSPL